MHHQHRRFSITNVLAALFLAISAIVLVRSVSLDSPPPIVTAALAFGSALVLQAATNSFPRRREIEADQRREKAKVYEGFMDLWFDEIMLPAQLEKNRTAPNRVSEELMRSMGNFTKKVILWGSDDVVREYLRYRNLQLGQSTGKFKPVDPKLEALERLFFAFRKDLGYANRGLAKRDLLALFINDLREPAMAPVESTLDHDSVVREPAPIRAERRSTQTDPPTKLRA